jgi:hypothetical protein
MLLEEDLKSDYANGTFCNATFPRLSKRVCQEFSDGAGTITSAGTSLVELDDNHSYVGRIVFLPRVTFHSTVLGTRP